MQIRVIFMACALLFAGCQAGKIPCPEIKFAKMKDSRAGKKAFFGPSPSKVYATTKTHVPSENKKKVDLERLKASRTTGKEMLEQYGSVEEWDCPSPNGKKRQSKIAKENVKRNEKKMREHLRQEHGPDSTSLIVPAMR
jgi:hypothetical protein